jgi:hypothetical protein
VAEEAEINLTATTTVIYKGRGGELKELHVKQPLDPNQKGFTFHDLQLLAREIANVLKEDAL